MGSIRGWGTRSCMRAAPTVPKTEKLKKPCSEREAACGPAPSGGADAGPFVRILVLPQLEFESVGLKACLLTHVAEGSRWSVRKSQVPCSSGCSRSSYTETLLIRQRVGHGGTWPPPRVSSPPLLGGGQLTPPDLFAAGTLNVDHISHQGALTGGWWKEPIFLLLDHFLLPRKLQGGTPPAGLPCPRARLCSVWSGVCDGGRGGNIQP